MSMIRKITPIALAIAALASAPAFASANSAASNTQVSLGNFSMNADNSNSATVNNEVLQHASGNIGLNNAAGSNNTQANSTAVSSTNSGDATASVSNTQAQFNGIFLPTGTQNMFGVSNNATLNNQVLQYATGNIGVNNASGDSNQQGNTTAVSVVNGNDWDSSNATASLDSDQLTGTASYSLFGVSTNAELENHVLQHASGNIAVNNAAGDNNQQGNGLAVAVNSDGDGMASASVDADQGAILNKGLSAFGVTNNAALENHVLEDASGNIGVNNAAGTGNQQGNFLAVAVTDDGLASATASTAQGGVLNGAGSFCGTTNSATVSNDVLENATGNIGVNNAAGANNQQLNSLAVASSVGQ